MHLLSSLLIGLVLVSLSAGADERVKLAEQLKHLKSLQANFTQQTARADGELVDSSEGQLTIQSGGKFHIKTEQPYPQLLVSNGIDFYSYDEELQQVIIQRLVKDINRIPVLLLGSEDVSFLDDFEITKVGQAYLLKPDNSSSVFTTLQLGFDGLTPTHVEIVDSLNQITRIELDATSVNPPLEQALFEFDAPQGVDLIDDR